MDSSLNTDKYYINQAIIELSGHAAIGSVVAHRSHEKAHTLIDITNGLALCELPDGTINIFPIAEVFDVNAVKRMAVQKKIMSAFEINRSN